MYPYFSKNGEVVPAEQALMPLNNIEYAYGFGVYETIRISNGKIYFLADHIDRLMSSARLIGLEHTFTIEHITNWVHELVQQNKAETCNIKLLLIGAVTPKQATLFIQCLPPLFPEKKLYTQGAKVITFNGERPIPHAKTLSMLTSYIAHREAKKNECYDALLINHRGHITEGTRTNFFGLKGKIIYSPPPQDILLGVTRHHVLRVAQQHDFELVEQQITRDDLPAFDSAFLTSTSSKIMPISTIDDFTYSKVSPQLSHLMSLFNNYLKSVHS